MSKFCRLIEDTNNNQLLLLAKPNDEYDDRADMSMLFKMDGAQVTITIGDADWEYCEKWMESFKEETAQEVFADPKGYLYCLMGMKNEED